MARKSTGTTQLVSTPVHLSYIRVKPYEMHVKLDVTRCCCVCVPLSEQLILPHMYVCNDAGYIPNLCFHSPSISRLTIHRRGLLRTKPAPLVLLLLYMLVMPILKRFCLHFLYYYSYCCCSWTKLRVLWSASPAKPSSMRIMQVLGS